MTALTLIDVLPDFGGAVARAAKPLRASSEPPAAEEAKPQPARRPDAEALLQARIEAAEKALAERLSREHEEAMEAERARHAEELEALQAQLAGEAGQFIRARLAETEERLTDLTAAATARILGMALNKDLQQRSLAALERIIREAIADREAVRIRVSGAVLLWDALRGGLGETAERVEFSEAPGFDLNVSIDERLFETRLAEWSDTVAGMVS